MSSRRIPSTKSRSYKPLKAIYGFKEPHLAWHSKCSADIKGIGFEELPSAPGVVRGNSAENAHQYILVWVDDLLITIPGAEQRSRILEELK